MDPQIGLAAAIGAIGDSHRRKSHRRKPKAGGEKFHPPSHALDQEAVRKGLASGTPWKYYDLGHGYCTYDFFDQCPHRMACAKCSFYQPKDSSAASLWKAKNNLLRMRQEIPLGESEIAALDDGIPALESLLNRLINVPTPAGPTPLQLRDDSLALKHAAPS